MHNQKCIKTFADDHNDFKSYASLKFSAMSYVIFYFSIEEGEQTS